jgi:hypothetical protein
MKDARAPCCALWMLCIRRALQSIIGRWVLRNSPACNRLRERYSPLRGEIKT